MFENEDLKKYLETSSSINSQSLVVAEWNMNIAENLSVIGNYRYRPTASPDSEDFVYSNLMTTFELSDCDQEIKFWCGATDADVVIDGGLDNDDQPIAFVQPNEKERLLYSLEDCFKRFRPRSGINKLRFFEDKYTNFYNESVSRRPRYYMASRNDVFKYWTSYRKENGIERGIANKPSGGLYYIDDAAPFVVYKDPIPANRIVVKMQTGVGDIDLGPFSVDGVLLEDPFYGNQNQETPSTWKIQVLQNNGWNDVISFSPFSSRITGEPVIGPDGYVEVAYGLILPDQYQNNIVFSGRYPMQELLPVNPPKGSAYFVKLEDGTDEVYVWNGSFYESFLAEYGWYLKEEGDNSNLVENLVDPDFFINSVGEKQYKEFEHIGGIRVVVQTMNTQNSTFDLIEMSPRLAVDISDKVSSFSVNKSASDLGVSGMPVGQLLASNGSLALFDYDDSFNENNEKSILSSFTNNNIQVRLFEKILDFSGSESKEYLVPIKTMYSEGFPKRDSQTRSVDVTLRDLFFYLESNNVPDILLENVPLSQAASIVLDNIGFSNYIFKRVNEEDDPTIPYFFITEDTSVAQVLQDLAIATQTAIFFDEENNLVFMSKNYIMPSEEQRPTDLELIGSIDQKQEGVVENLSTRPNLANIVDLSSQDNEIFNDGKITYTEKYIAKTYGSLQEASFLNQDQNWIYKPALLWEVAGTPPLRSIEDESETTSSYSLAAVSLNSDLTDETPVVFGGQLENNVIDFGEGAYWVARYNGFFYANGEIIKYDAIEYNVSGLGNVWVSSLSEYQNYFSKVKFGGKIFPTGRIRIYAEPFYEEIEGIVVMKNGEVNKHGRAQFGTDIAYHTAGLSEYWSDTSSSAPVQGVEMDSRYLFADFPDRDLAGVYSQEGIEMEVEIDIDDPSAINDIVFAASKWVAVGNDGDFRISSDGETWTIIEDDEFDENYIFNSVAYGAGPSGNIWLAVGSKPDGENRVAAMASSSDAENWTEVTGFSFDSDSLNKVVFKNNTWLLVGNNGLVATSSNTSSWTVRNVKLDYSVFGDASKNKPKVLSATKQETIRISKIQPGSPGVIVSKRHGFKENDIITLTTQGTLPGELNTTTEYFVRPKNRDSFLLKTSSGGSPINIGSKGTGRHFYTKKAATFTSRKHRLKDNEIIRVIENGTLPTELSEDTRYYVRVVNSDNFHLSPTKDGALINFVATQLSSTHVLDKFASYNLFAADFGNNQWAIGGQGGVFSTSSNLSTWTAYRTNLKENDILSILFADNQWLSTGLGGRAQRSTNLISWSGVKTRLKKNITCIAFGNGVWIAGGQGARISVSSNLQKWKVLNPKFGTATINVLAFANGYWLALGEKLYISKSTDNGVKWNDKSQENVGELLFTTNIPHNFTPFDTINFTSTGELVIENGTPVNISVGTPVNFSITNNKKHKLNSGDKIKLVTAGELPSGLSLNTIYYVIRTGKKSFQVSLSAGGAPVNASGTHFGQHQFILNPIIPNEPNTKYFVTPKRISKYSFTVAETRSDARLGITFKGNGYGVGDHKVKLFERSDEEIVSSISAQSLTGALRVRTEASHELSVGDRIFFAIKRNNEYTDKRLPHKIVRYAPYYVSNIISSTDFRISESLGGPDLVFQSRPIEMEANETIVIILNITDEVIQRNILSPKDVAFSVANLIEVTKGEGELVSPTRITAIRPKNIIEKEVVISIGSPAVITCENHGLFSLDQIQFKTTGELPFGINTNTNYLVDKIDSNSFQLFDPFSKKLIATEEGENPDAEIPGDLEADDTPVTIMYRSQKGKHFFIKDINDTNRIVVGRRVGSLLPQYSVSEEEVLVDEEDGETEEQLYYEDISFQNQITAIEELEVTKEGKAGISDSNRELALSGTRNGILKNFLTKSSFSETDVNKFLSTQTGTIQSSALVFNGPSFEFLPSKQVLISTGNPASFITATNHDLQNNDTIKFTTSGALPSGIIANKRYYVIRIDEKRFSVANTIGGAAISASGTQSGNHQFAVLLKRPIDFVSYIHKSLESYENKFTHFGTRMRIVGRLSQEDRQQVVSNSLSYFLNPQGELDEDFSVYGGSGGIALMVNPETNVGYYFEIIGLSQSNVAEYESDVGLFNVVFYKILRKVPNEEEPEVFDSSKAIPFKLWQGVTSISVDDGTMVGQFRMANEPNPSVYDVSVEYEEIDENTRRFYLMINNKILSVVDDKDPLPVYNNFALFTRGSARIMFENVYALSNNYSQNTVFELDAPVNSVFGAESLDVSQSFRKYALSGAIQSTYLSGLSSSDSSKYKIYFEEFGTIMRECAYFNIRYDKAFPALYARISDTFNKMKGYTVSGFTPTAYGAEFLVFNNTDTALNLDETSGNYLRIQGVTFTQNSEKELTVDDYFERISNLADPDIREDGTIVSPIRAKQEFLDIRNSRITNGRKEFVITSPYIQSQDSANELMGWIISKIMKPRKSVGLSVFAMPTIQLGDIVKVDYASKDSTKQIPNDNRFVVYNIEYSRNETGPSMNVFLSEVI